jgi:signal transduction histidine kinase
MLLAIVVFSFLFKELLIDSSNIFPMMALIAISFAVILYILYNMLSKVQQELTRINDYLLDIKSPQNRDYLTKELSLINKNLIEVLNSSKKREIDKRKYSAKLKLKNRQRSDMLSAIAHEFRNPISAIIGYAQTIHEDPKIPQPLRDKFLLKISNNGEKIEELLSRLLLWNNFESGDTKLHLNKFDMVNLSKEVAQNLQEKYKNREIDIECNVDSLIFDADRTLIDIVLKNLVENALKYSEDKVTIKIEDRKVSIIDRGIGISEEDISKVTKKFYRTDLNSWDNSMGLGLAIVKTILSLHNIDLEIESQKSVGSRFFFIC